MPADNGITVTPSTLDTQASRLDTVADDIGAAKQAGDAVRLDAQAYGKLCTMVPVLLGVLQSMVIDGIDTAAHSVSDTAQRLRTASTGYQSSDQRSRDSFDRLRRAL
jgi:excreted virulence factor EspC (type VII ESX diderm)